MTHIVRNANGVPTAIISPDGVRTDLTIYGQNHLTEVIHPDGGYYSFEYSAGGLMTAEVDPMGNRFEYTFDDNGRLIDVTDPEGGLWKYAVTENPDGTVVTEMATAEGQRTVYEDLTLPSGEFTSRITGPTGSVTEYSRSDRGETPRGESAGRNRDRVPPRSPRQEDRKEGQREHHRKVPPVRDDEASGRLRRGGQPPHALLLYADGRTPLAVEKEGVLYYLAYDPAGSLRAVADAAGNVVKRIGYDAFGNIIEDSDPLFDMPLGFAGGLQDRDTGLVRFGYRDYDPENGRWAAKDPIGFAGGDTDLYGYCLNDPVNGVDPDGLNPMVGAEVGATIGSAGGPPGAVIGGIIGAAAGLIIGQWVWDNWIDKEIDSPCMEARKKKHKKPENPNRRKGAEDRQKTGDRERNVGHTDGEEHSKRPKGGFKH